MISSWKNSGDHTLLAKIYMLDLHFWDRFWALHSAILINSDPSTNVFLKIISYYKTLGTAISMWHLWTAFTELAGNSHSSCPLLPLFYMRTWGKWVEGQPKLKFIFLLQGVVIIWWYMVGGSGWIVSQFWWCLICFFYVHLIYYIQRSLTQGTAFN